MKKQNGIEVKFSFDVSDGMSNELCEAIEKYKFTFQFTPTVGWCIDFTDFTEEFEFSEELILELKNSDDCIYVIASIYIQPSKLLAIIKPVHYKY